MSIKTNIPQIAALKNEVERLIGHPLNTHNGFLELVGKIEDKQRDHISESTLERLWGYSTRRCDSVSEHTLNILCRYVGSLSWKDFCILLKRSSPRESEEFTSLSGIDVSSLKSGDKLCLRWMPDRKIEVEYQGEFRFKVLSSTNSSINAGDSFSCLQIEQGRELFLDKYSRKGECGLSSYVIGRDHGITSAELLVEH